MKFRSGDVIIAEDKGRSVFELLFKRDGKLVPWSVRDEREFFAIEFDGLVSALWLVAKLSDLKIRITKKGGDLEARFFV